MITLFFIFFWNENYGHDESNFDDKTDDGNLQPHTAPSPSPSTKAKVESSPKPTFFQSMLTNMHTIAQHPKICLIGLSQACFEGAVFTFGKYISYLLNCDCILY